MYYLDYVCEPTYNAANLNFIASPWNWPFTTQVESKNTPKKLIANFELYDNMGIMFISIRRDPL